MSASRVLPKWRYGLLAGLGLAMLAGCAVGPNYRGAPKVAPQETGAAAFHRAPKDLVTNSPGVALWWGTLHDPELNQLIETALAHSPDLRAAEARLKQSRAGLRQQQRNELPKGSASATYLKADIPGFGSMGLYNVGFDATWEVDLFGGTRRAIESASADAAAVEADLADAQVQLSAEVAQAYIDLRDRQQRIALVRKSAEIEEQVLALTQ